MFSKIKRFSIKKFTSGSKDKIQIKSKQKTMKIKESIIDSNKMSSHNNHFDIYYHKFNDPNFLYPSEQLLDSLILNNKLIKKNELENSAKESEFIDNNKNVKPNNKNEWKKISDQIENPWYYSRFKLFSFTAFIFSGFYIYFMEMDYFSNKYINVNKLKYLII